MNHGQIDFQDVLKLVELIKSSSNFSEIRLRSGDVEVELRRAGAAGFAAPAAAPAAASIAAPAPAAAAVPAPPAKGSPPPAPAAPVAPAKRAALPQGATLVKAPMVGTVYRAPEPGAKPFIEVGQQVAAGDPLCIIEVMKLMNSISAEAAGVVSEILVADGEAVQYGQELFVISPR